MRLLEHMLRDGYDRLDTDHAGPADPETPSIEGIAVRRELSGYASLSHSHLNQALRGAREAAQAAAQGREAWESWGHREDWGHWEAWGQHPRTWEPSWGSGQWHPNAWQ